MIDPTFIFTVADDTDVTTPDGTDNNIDRVAAWSWSTRTDDDGTELYCLSAASGTIYIPVAGVTDITNLAE